tara:strand:- start:2659 stop:3180 length:522 start_codon:yes stop_codon:yes gene_type:complete
MAGKRQQFTKVPSSGDNDEGDKLYRKYQAYLKKQDADITDMDDLFDNMDAYDLNINDCNWIRTYSKTNLGFNYPSNSALLGLYKTWYGLKKTGEMDVLGDELWNHHFRKLADKHDSANKKKDWNEAYLRRKLQKIINALMKHSGKDGLPNPIGAGTRRSAEDVVKAADLSWLD